jgi:hypothetical protein
VLLVPFKKGFCCDVAGWPDSESARHLFFCLYPPQSINSLLARVRFDFRADALPGCVDVGHAPNSPIFAVKHPIAFFSLWHFDSLPSQLIPLRPVRVFPFRFA